MLYILENSALQMVAHLCIHMSVDGYLWSAFNSAELSTMATLIAPYGGIWQVGLKKTDKNIVN